MPWSLPVRRHSSSTPGWRRHSTAKVGRLEVVDVGLEPRGVGFGRRLKLHHRDRVVPAIAVPEVSVPSAVSARTSRGY